MSSFSSSRSPSVTDDDLPRSSPHTSQRSADGENSPEQAIPRPLHSVKLTPASYVPSKAVLSPNAAHRERTAAPAPSGWPGTQRYNSDRTAYHSGNVRDLVAAMTVVETTTMTREELPTWSDANHQLQFGQLNRPTNVRTGIEMKRAPTNEANTGMAVGLSHMQSASVNTMTPSELSSSMPIGTGNIDIVKDYKKGIFGCLSRSSLSCKSQ